MAVGLLFSLIPQVRQEAARLFQAKTFLVLISAGLNLISWLLFFIALQIGSISTVYPIYTSFALIATVGLGIIWLKETSRLPQKILGSILVIAGIFLLG